MTPLTCYIVVALANFFIMCASHVGGWPVSTVIFHRCHCFCPRFVFVLILHAKLIVTMPMHVNYLRKYNNYLGMK